MEAQGADWVDSIRYFRGLAPARRRSSVTTVMWMFLIALAIVTIAATVQQFGW